MKRLILTALSFAMVVAAKADIIRGYVVDVETGEALAAANVYLKGAQKKFGRTTGWVSYTWAKSFRTFDHPGKEINGGKEFYDPTDRRHNFNVVTIAVTATGRYQHRGLTKADDVAICL